MIYDVTIAGAGPAGSLLAYTLASKGLNILVLEKFSFPRYKPCGGGLTLKALHKLPFDINQVIEFSAGGGIISYRGEEILKIATEDPVAYLISRPDFDAYLIEKAIVAGAKFADNLALVNFEKQNEKIIVNTEKDKFISTFLVGADGVRSTVADITGLLKNRDTGAAIEAEVHVPSKAKDEQGTFVTFDFGAIPNGYGWIFPKIDHLSIGLAHAQSRTMFGLNNYFDKFLNNHSVLKNAKVYIRKGHLVPIGGKDHTLHNERVLLVGDAANLVDPWLGEGINYAFWSASIAAEVIINSFHNQSLDISNYSSRVNFEITSQLRHARMLANIFYQIPHLSTLLIRRSHLLQQLVIGILKGNLNFRDLNKRLLASILTILKESLF